MLLILIEVSGSTAAGAMAGYTFALKRSCVHLMHLKDIVMKL